MDIKTGATTYQYDYLHSAPDSYSTYNNLPANLTNTHHSPRKLAYIISNLQKSPLLNQNLQDNIDLKVNDRALIDTVTNYQVQHNVFLESIRKKEIVRFKEIKQITRRN